MLTDGYPQLLYGKWLLEADAEPELSKERLAPSEHALYANELLMVGRLFGRPHHLVRLLDDGLGRGWWCRMATAVDSCEHLYSGEHSRDGARGRTADGGLAAALGLLAD